MDAFRLSVSFSFRDQVDIGVFVVDSRSFFMEHNSTNPNPSHTWCVGRLDVLSEKNRMVETAHLDGSKEVLIRMQACHVFVGLTE